MHNWASGKVIVKGLRMILCQFIEEILYAHFQRPWIIPVPSEAASGGVKTVLFQNTVRALCFRSKQSRQTHLENLVRGNQNKQTLYYVIQIN